MELQSDKLKQLHQVLSKTFTHGELKRLSEFELQKRLEEITVSQNLSDVALELINWAEAKNFLKELIEGALKINSRNPILQALVNQISSVPQSLPGSIASFHQEAEILMQPDKPGAPPSESGDINPKRTRRPQIAKQQAKELIPSSEDTGLQPALPASSKEDSPQQSPLTILALALLFSQEIKQKQMQLLPVYLLFGVDAIEEVPPEQYETITRSELFKIEDIWPEHCDITTHLLQEAVQPMQRFYDLVNGALTRERTTEIVQFQSSLTIPLRMSCEILRNLISLVYECREICQNSPDDMPEQRREIMDNLKELRETIGQINIIMDAYSP